MRGAARRLSGGADAARELPYGVAEQVERLTSLRSRQKEYDKQEARLHKEIQFNRKVALNPELREVKTEIDRLGA